MSDNQIYLGFKGMADATLDDNNRMSIPAKYKDALGDMFVACFGAGPHPCLYFFPLATWEDLCRELNGKGAEIESTPEAEWMRRNLYSRAEDIKIDAKKRITIPAHMCKYAQLSGEVLLAGNMKRIEVWNPEIHAAAEKEYMSNMRGQLPKLNY